MRKKSESHHVVTNADGDGDRRNLFRLFFASSLGSLDKTHHR